MNRTSMVAILILFSVLLGGCLTGTSGGDGQFEATVVSEAPPNTTILDYSDERVQANEYLREAIREAAAADSGEIVVTVPENEVEQTKTDIQELPLYNPDESVSDQYQWGYYFEYDGSIVRIEFVILD